MTAASTMLTTEPMRRKRTPDEYRLYNAALEWDLLDPIVIDKRDDLKSEAVWKDHLEPFNHQVSNLITFCRRLPVTLLADDVGLGKTISAGLVISELVARGRVNKVLVVCPKLLGPQWHEELQSKFKFESEVVVGHDLVDVELDGPGAVITTYTSARLYLDDIPKERFEMLILDEAHKLRNLYGTGEPPQVATRFRTALEERRFRYVLMLTATPIHNRLWDLYSLVDLLTVARGHRNPFGSEGEFARRFISDARGTARVLKDEARDEFRSIVYGYMSRVRRADAGLHFPERVVQMHRVPPTAAELQLIGILAKALKKLNKLAQISLLQAVVSSPDALLAQLTNMARKGTVPEEVRAAVAAVVKSMPHSAKLVGLAALIKRLQAEDPTRWRLVVFTTRLETQTTIEVFLTRTGLKVGTINGTSGPRNQQILARFRRNPPECNVIVSTEAGAEGVNLQVANVLVNFDLPWNPMIVEQRIGRIQRLASNYERVAIYNIILAGTFEEYVVGRLMQKLQMASSAIGDIESILEAAGMDEDDGANSFEEQIRRLVVKALEERDVERDTALAEASIEKAKAALEEHRETLETMLGSGAGEGKGPRLPVLPPTKRSMTARDFAERALRHLGGRFSPRNDGTYFLERGDRSQRISFDPRHADDAGVTVYAPGTRAFENLVDRLVQAPVHDVSESESEPEPLARDATTRWVESFEGSVEQIAVRGTQRKFEGSVLVRARVTVAHDSYERLVSVRWNDPKGVKAGAWPIRETISDLAEVGVGGASVVEAATADDGIAEFRRFYTERRAEEVARAGTDLRRAKKLEDEFTPRLTLNAVGLDGSSQRLIDMEVRFRFDDSPVYSSHLLVGGQDGGILEAPPLGQCSVSRRSAPTTCLGRCEVSGAIALKHLLVVSEVSGRFGLPDRVVRCVVSGKRALQDEVELSAVTGAPVLRSLLKTSQLSGKRAEPEHFGICQFTGAELLNSELAMSELSERRFRSDQAKRSDVTGRMGHTSEIFTCPQTGKNVAEVEGEKCWATKTRVAPGVLRTCEITGRRVLPEHIGICAITKKAVHRDLLIASSLSGLLALEKVAVRSRAGAYCLPTEARRCRWTGRAVHPDDIGHCSVTGLPIDKPYLGAALGGCLEPAAELLAGRTRPADAASESQRVAAIVERSGVSGKIVVDSTLLSPDKRTLLAGLEVRTMLGFRVHHAVAAIDLKSNAVVGRVTLGKRTAGAWSPSN